MVPGTWYQCHHPKVPFAGEIAGSVAGVWARESRQAGLREPGAGNVRRSLPSGLSLRPPAVHATRDKAGPRDLERTPAGTAALER